MTSVSAEAGVDPVTSEKATAGRLEDREEGEATSRLTYLSHALEASAGLLAPHRLRVRRTAQFFFCAENPSRFGGVRCRRGMLHISDGGRDWIRCIFRQIAETAKLVS
jgi:hypothetical protein